MLPPASPTPAPSAAAEVDFDRVAGWYDGAARLVFGAAQHDAQRAALAGLPPGAPQLLILGGGSGWVLGEVWARRPAATVLYVDASAAMLRRAEALVRAQWPERQAQIECRLGTEAVLAPTESFDAVLTFFVFDCMTPPALAAAAARLAARLRPGGTWLVAEFTAPRRWWQRVLQHAMYAFFRVMAGLRVRRLPDYEAALGAQGWRPTQTWYFFGGAIAGAIFTHFSGATAKK